MGIKDAPSPVLHDLKSFGNQEEGGHSDDHDQPFQACCIAEFGRFQTEQPAFIIEKAFFDLEAFAVFGERVDAGWFITDDLPLF